MLLYDQVKMCKVSPVDYLKCFLRHVEGETEQSTLIKIIGKVEYITNFLIMPDAQKEMSEQIFSVLMKKINGIESTSLRNLLLTQTIDFATTPIQKTMLVGVLEAGKLPVLADSFHTLTKTQRYMIIRQIWRSSDFTLDQKQAYLKAEMQIDYSDVDENQRIRCEACLSSD